VGLLELMACCIPKVVFGTSALGNLYEELPYSQKKDIVKEIIEKYRPNDGRMITFDCAGKYGAGLALETLGRILTDLNIDPNMIQISNKLGWRRVPLTHSSPTFETGVWVNLLHDAVLDVSYQGIIRAYHEGNQLLGNYRATIVSVHDPDEYLSGAEEETDLLLRMKNLSEAYRALFELKSSGQVRSVGVGSKDYKIIQYIGQKFPLDWIMTACSLTPLVHPSPHLVALKSLSQRGEHTLSYSFSHTQELILSTPLSLTLVS
jgi:D-threo-aldose 1-dehydrogenase